MKLLGLDHLVLTVASIEKTMAFYTQVLGFEAISFGAGRQALKAGSQKINLHQVGAELAPFARWPQPGSADLCLIYAGTTEQISAALAKHHIKPELGPVLRTGATGTIESIYIRDPDHNLLELSVYQQPQPHQD